MLSNLSAMRSFAFLILSVVQTAPAAPPSDYVAQPLSNASPAFSVKVSGQGKPMILIPGLTCGGDVWNTTVDHFKDRYECHVLTLAGFAGQPPIAGPMMDMIRRDIVTYVREKKFVHPVIVGHSLGGFLAFWIASSEPGLVGPVISVDGLPFYSALFNPEATSETSRPMAESMRQVMSGQTAAQFSSQNKMFLSSMITDPKNVELIAPVCSKSDPKAVANAMYDLMTIDLRAEVAKIKAPVLFIGAGGNFPNSEQKARRKKLSEDQLAKISNHRVAFAETSKHFIMFDDPKFLFSTMDEFLQNQH